MSLVDDVDADTRSAHDAMHWPLALASCGYVIAYTLSLVEVVTVLASGPVLALVAVWLAWRAVAARSVAGALLGVGLVVLVATLFVTVNLLSWSPTEAEEPFAVIGAVVGMFVVGLTLAAIARQERPTQPAGLFSHQPVADGERRATAV